MKQSAINYGKVLYELGIAAEVIDTTEQLYRGSVQLQEALRAPVVSEDEKYKIITRIFPEEIQKFLKVLCHNHKADQLLDVIAAYRKLKAKEDEILEARLYYVLEPSKENLDGIKDFLKKKFHRNTVEMELIQDASLIGGFILQAEEVEYDQSVRGTMNRLTKKLQRR